MKNLGNITIFFAMSVLSVLSGFSQTPANSADPKFDAELAKKLGADEMGMRQYVLAILKTGPNDAAVKGDERSKLFQGHFANMTRLANEGKLAVAGPFGQNERSFRGLLIFAVSTVDAAKALAETDPTVRSGIFVVEYVPWFGSAALMQVTETHGKISKKSL